MGHVLNLYDGTTTIQLGPVLYEDGYTPATPQTDMVEYVPSGLHDGGEVPVTTRRNVTETVKILIHESTRDAVRAKLRQIELMLLQAEHYQRTRLGAPVWVQFQPGGTGDIYRSELLSGRVELSVEALDENWYNTMLEAAVIWTRRYFWEGPEVELPLTNLGGSGTGGRTVYNQMDSSASKSNYVDIDGDDITGSLPSQPRIVITNNYASTNRTKEIYLAQNTRSAPATLNHWIEGESASMGGSDVNDANYSGGKARYRALPTTEGELFRWDLTAAQLALMGGNYFRVLARMVPLPFGAYFRLVFLLTGLSPIASGPLVKTPALGGDELLDLGVLRLPPWIVGTGIPVASSLALYGYDPAGVGYVQVDYLQLSCLDGYAFYKPLAYNLPQNYQLIDDLAHGDLHAQSTGGIHCMGMYQRFGNGVTLWPGQATRLYLLQNDDGSAGGVAAIARTLSVRVYHRPRRLTL